MLEPLAGRADLTERGIFHSRTKKKKSKNNLVKLFVQKVNLKVLRMIWVFSEIFILVSRMVLSNQAGRQIYKGFTTFAKDSLFFMIRVNRLNRLVTT